MLERFPQHQPTTVQPSVLAWHFLAEDGCLRGTREKVIVGKAYEVEGPASMRYRGFHGLTCAIDALCYACGPIVCRTLHEGEIITGLHGLASSRLTVLAMASVDQLLHRFACDVAETFLTLSGVSDAPPWNAVKTKRAWIEGDDSSDDLLAARSAAWDAKRVNESGEKGSAWNAAKNAARESGWASARSALQAVGWLTSKKAKWRAAWSSLNTQLTTQLCEALAA